jgi:hypothetical protein
MTSSVRYLSERIRVFLDCHLVEATNSMLLDHCIDRSQEMQSLYILNKFAASLGISQLTPCVDHRQILRLGQNFNQ